MPGRLESPVFALRGLVYPHNHVVSLRNQSNHPHGMAVTQLLQSVKPEPESLDQREGWTVQVVSVV